MRRVVPGRTEGPDSHNPVAPGGTYAVDEPTADETQLRVVGDHGAKGSVA